MKCCVKQGGTQFWIDVDGQVAAPSTFMDKK